jgi:hypothetical protein
MKTILSLAAFIAMFAAPVFAEKTPVEPKQTCVQDTALAEWVIIYHLDQIDMVIDEMRQNILNQEQKLSLEK